MLYINAFQLKERLESSGIYNAQGSVNMELNGTSVLIKSTDTIGNNIQEWLSQWLLDSDIYHKPPQNTQNFPDFFLSPETNTGLLEVKSYYSKRSPGFDVANFDSYWKSLKESPQRLDADYMIFAYDLVNGQLMIRQIYLKKVWEITGASGDYPLKCQIKNGQIYNIRPISFNSTRSTFRPFSSKEEFVVAIYQTLLPHTRRASEVKDWLHQVISGYANICGHDMSYDINRLLSTSYHTKSEALFSVADTI